MNRADLTDEMIDLLSEGAKTSYGRCCYPMQARKLGRSIEALRAAGLVYMGDNGETPLISDAGRAAVGGSPRADLERAEMVAHRSAAMAVTTASQREIALKLSRRKDDRIAFQICIHDESPNYFRISLDGNPKNAQNLYRTSYTGFPPIVVTHRDGRFAVAHIRGREVIKFGFVQRNVPVLSKDVEWTIDEVRTWRTLRLEMLRLRHNLEEQRRRAKGLRPDRGRMRFGEMA